MREERDLSISTMNEYGLQAGIRSVGGEKAAMAASGIEELRHMDLEVP